METLIVTVDGLDYVIGSYGDFADTQEFICRRLCEIGMAALVEELDYPTVEDFEKDIFYYANNDPTYFDDLVKAYYLRPEGGNHGD